MKEFKIPKYVISVEELKRRYESLKEIEVYDLNDIMFLENGKILDISQETIDSFDFTGLTNRDFIFTEYYKRK